MPTQYKRIILKISGEILGCRSEGEPIHAKSLETICEEIKFVSDMGVEVGLVVGGGNIFRGLQGSEKGKRWTRKALDKMAALWAEMLKTAHLSANMYVLGEYKNDPETKEETGPTLLVSLDKAWQQKEITRFIATKPEVLKLTKDRRTLTAANFADDDEDDDEL